MFSCGKEDLSNEDSLFIQEDSDSESGIVTEEYVYQGISYSLEYDESDEAGAPIESEALYALSEAIGEKDYYSVRNAENLRKIFLYDSEEEFNEAMGYNDILLEELEDIENGNSPELETGVSERSPLMDYFEHSRFTGSKLSGDDVSGIACRGTNCCGKLWHKSDLRTVPRGSTGNWNDVITSLKVDPSSIITNKNDKVQIVFYRDAGFPQKGCQKEGFTMDSNGLSISNLRSFRWCFWGGRMNDDINGWTLSICKVECNNCWNNS